MGLRYKRRIQRIRDYIEQYKELSDAQLQGLTEQFKERLEQGASTNEILEEAYAAICEADYRILGMMPYDEQIMGAIAIHNCNLAEMRTGEGKTLMATMPLYLHGLTGRSTILVTANDYLAIRDAKDMGPVYNFMGLSVRAGVSEDPDEEFDYRQKQENYGADILYTTHSVLGFDYLFQNLVKDPRERFLRDYYFIIIDEADMVLLDAAQMPLVISGTPRVQSNLYEITDFFASILVEDQDYKIEDKAIWLTDDGVKFAEQFFGIDNFYGTEYFEINRHVTLALRARYIFGLQKDYVITEKGEIMLLDNGSGRMMPGMKLRGGQHQALEMKEKLKISQEQRSVASITYQNLFRLFPKMAGMSGTLCDARLELFKIYGKRVVTIPTHKPCQRVDQRDQYFQNGYDQFQALIADVKERYEKGQPMLIVTSTIQDTKVISSMLLEHHIPHSVLNANNVFWEADIIKEAGRVGAVTVSTGMAGRGTDIKLQKEAKALGGLAVLGVGRMDNTRLERQVRGRAGRQGDPGISQFYVSLEDEIVKTMGDHYVERLQKKRRIPQGQLRRIIDQSQKLHMDQAVQARNMFVDYDRILKRQREILYEARNRLLDNGEVTEELIEKICKYNIKGFVKHTKHLSSSDLSRYVLDNISYEFAHGFNPKVTYRGRNLRRYIIRYSQRVYREKMGDFETPEQSQEFLRLCILKALDDVWVEQVDYLQQLQSAILGRGSTQRNPVFEYSKEAYRSFQRMEDTMQEKIMRNIFLGMPEYAGDGTMNIVYP